MNSKKFQVRYDAENDQIVAQWAGYQTLPSIKEGGNEMLDAIKKHKCATVLNDNTNVKGTWFFAFEWAGQEWFPEMINAGLKNFAWILSADTLAHGAAMAVINQMDKDEVIIKTFHPGNIQNAKEWIDIRKNNV